MNAENLPGFDNLQLARCLCDQIARRLQGILSVGLGALMMRGQEEFVAGRRADISAFVRVLGCSLPYHREGPAAAHKLRVANQLGQQVESFFDHFRELSRWRDLSDDQVAAVAQALGEAYADQLNTLQSLSASLGSEFDPQQQIVQAREMITSFAALVAEERQSSIP